MSKAKKPQRRRPVQKAKVRRRSFSGPLARLAWGAGLILVLLGLGLAWWLGGSPRPETPPASTAFLAPGGPQPDAAASRPDAAAPPVFEEPYRPLAPLSDLQRVDEAIFSGLRDAGVDPGHMHVSVRALPDGEITTIAVTLPKDADPVRVRRFIADRLQDTDGSLRPQAGADGLVLEVVLHGAITHRVALKGPPGLPAAPQPRPAAHKPRVALVFDDLGYQMEPARELLSLGLNVTLSILPHGPHSKDIADLARGSGNQVLVHLPMEPNSYPHLDPGPGRLLVSMDAAALARATRQDLDGVPGAVGANNHMGSRLTASAPAMRAVLGVLKERGLFFLDSATSPQSKALDEARRLGVPAARRNLFLDHEQSYRAVSRQLERLLKLAGGQDGLIAIGHPHRATLKALKDYAPRLKKNLELVPVSALIRP